MRKTSSAGNLFDNSNKNKFNKIHKKLSLKNSNKFQHQYLNDPTSFRKNKVIFSSQVKSFGDSSNIFSSSTLAINNRPNIIFDNPLNNNKTGFTKDFNVQRKLYEELMVLKKKVNFLNAQIALEKSSKRKKDVQITTKARQIKSYQSDIKMSKDITPVNIDKLKNSNVISHLKKEFQTAKLNLDAKKNETKNMEAFLKKAKPNILRQENIVLEQKLKKLLKEYKDLLELNSINTKKISEMEGLHQIFVKNHEKIEGLRQRKENLEKNINYLQENINLMSEANYKNEETLMKQNKNKMNYNRHIEHLMKEKKNKEEILKMKMTYKQQINKLEEEEKDYRDKYANNEKQIKDLKENIYLIEKMMKIDPYKMKSFDYSKIKEIEKNPHYIINSKILLLQSLINESNNNTKRYQEIINTYIYRFNELGFDYTQLDKPQNEQNRENNKDNNDAKKEGEENNDNKIIEENPNENEMNNNNDRNMNEIKEENDDIVNFKNKTEDNKNENIENNNEENNKNQNDIENNNNNNIDIKKDSIETPNKENLVSFDKNKNDNNLNNNNTNINSSDKKIPEEQKANPNEINNNENDSDINKNVKNDIHNQKTEDLNGLNSLKEESKKESQENNINNLQNNNNDIIKEKSDDKKLISENKNDLNSLSNEEFTEFTYILIKNFESKKISEETARQKIIMIPSTKDPLDDNKFIEQMSFNIMKSVHCEHKESLEKVKKWLVTLFILCSNDQKKVTENFLTLFNNITIYTQDQEILLGKKVKKSFINKKEEIHKKCDIYKDSFVTFDFMKKIIEDEKIIIKDEYVQYLFFEMKRFEDPSRSLYDLKMKNLYDILDNNENESKMDTESDIEITNEEYISIITGFGTQLLNYLERNHTDLRTVLGDIVQNLSGEDSAEKIEVVYIEPFVNRMKEIGIELNDEIKIYCLFSRYKLSDEYEIISVNLLEKELENFKNSKINYSNEINAISSALGNNIADMNNMNDIGPSYKNKVMEKVQEENEENVSI